MTISLWSGRWRGRSPAGDAHTRSRNVISPSGGIMRAKFPSHKNGRLIHCEGLLELDAAYLLEINPAVAGFREQPAAHHYPDGNRTRRYTPDFEVTLTSGEVVLVEVKPRRSLAKTEVRRTLDCVKRHFDRNDRAFAILTDEVLREQPRRANACAICHRAQRSEASIERLWSAVRRGVLGFPVSIDQATPVLAGLGLNPFSLMLVGALRCDLSRPIVPSTELSLAEEGDHAWFQLSEEHGF